MVNGRLYRVSFLPFVLALFVAAFSLGKEPAPATSPLAPNAFEGTRAAAELSRLAERFPARRPGSPGDNALAAYIASTLRSLGRAANGGFVVHTVATTGQTIEGERRLQTVIAQRAGSTGLAPIVIVAHRDAASRGSEAELSGTVALIELGRVFAARQTRRAIVLVSTSGGSGGNAGARSLSSLLGTQPDAALVLGDVAGVSARQPIVVNFSEGPQTAPLVLQRTVAAAIERGVSLPVGNASTVGQLAHLVFPFTAGEEAPLNSSGIGTVQLQVSGETGPAPDEPVSPERLTAFGRAALEAVDALDGTGELSEGQRGALVLTPHVLPGWAVALVLYTLLLPAAVGTVDAMARARRRRLPLGRQLVWTLSCAAPFFVAAAFVALLAALGVLGPTPPGAILPRAIAISGRWVGALAATALVFAAAWLAWGALVRRFRLGRLPDSEVGGLAVVAVLLAATLISVPFDPYTLLLALPALHLWLLLADADLRPPRFAGALLVVAGLVPLAGLIVFYALHFGYDVPQLAWSALNLIASGQVTVAGALLWSAALGAAAGAAFLVAAPEEGLPRGDGERRVSIRGPVGYAGPGSLGGTESALRR